MSEEPKTFLRWPPPGLERMQGDLWRVAARSALSGGVLVLPLLFVLSRRQDFASQGPLADAWWVTFVLATVGLGLAMDAFANVSRVLRRGASALERGYDSRTVVFVLSDLRRDMGFLLQGRRHFSVMEPKARAGVAHLRVLAVGFFALAGIWLSAALGVLLLVAARGGITPTGLWMTTLLPAAFFYAVGIVASGLEGIRVQKARREWFSQPWSKDLVVEEIEGWREDLAKLAEPALQGRVHAARAPLLRRAGMLAVAVAVVVAVPVLGLFFTSAAGRIVLGLAVPAFDRVQQRAAEVEAFRGYGVAPDPSVTPAEAGEILQNLLYAGRADPPADGELEPSLRIEADWLPNYSDGNPVGAEPHRWPEEIFHAVTDQPSQELVSYLADVAAHEGHAHFARLARASDLDAAVGRWLDPLPSTINFVSIPIPHGFIELLEGRPDRAEEAIREVISVGLLLGDQAPTLIDNLVGYVIAAGGGQALEHFYLATGQTREAAELAALREVSSRTADRIHATLPNGIESLVRALPDIVSDSGAVRGLRWELFAVVTTLTPCLNLQRMVFGPDDGYTRFVERAHDILVRWPSEEGLFELARAGYQGGAADVRPSILVRVLGVSTRSGPGTCSDLLASMEAQREAM